MIDEIKLMLGEAAANFSDAIISLCLKQALVEVKSYCKRELDEELELIAQRITIIKLNRINTEGLSAQAFSGVSESYVDGYPDDIIKALNAKRKLKVI